MGTALAIKRGEKTYKDLPETVRGEVRTLLRTMPDRELREYAQTQTTGLPRRASHRAGREGINRVRSS